MHCQLEANGRGLRPWHAFRALPLWSEGHLAIQQELVRFLAHRCLDHPCKAECSSVLASSRSAQLPLSRWCSTEHYMYSLRRETRLLIAVSCLLTTLYLVVCANSPRNCSKTIVAQHKSLPSQYTANCMWFCKLSVRWSCDHDLTQQACFSMHQGV